DERLGTTVRGLGRGLRAGAGQAGRARARAPPAPLEPRLLAPCGDLGDLGTVAGWQLGQEDDVVPPALTVEREGRLLSDGLRWRVGREWAVLRIAELNLGLEARRRRALDSDVFQSHGAACIKDE